MPPFKGQYAKFSLQYRWMALENANSSENNQNHIKLLGLENGLFDFPDVEERGEEIMTNV